MVFFWFFEVMFLCLYMQVYMYIYSLSKINFLVIQDNNFYSLLVREKYNWEKNLILFVKLKIYLVYIDLVVLFFGLYLENEL